MSMQQIYLDALHAAKGECWQKRLDMINELIDRTVVEIRQETRDKQINCPVCGFPPIVDSLDFNKKTPNQPKD